MSDCDTLTEYVARQTMELKDVNFCTSFVSTVWRDIPVLIIFDNLGKKIIDTWFHPTLQQDDLKILTKLVNNFLN